MSRPDLKKEFIKAVASVVLLGVTCGLLGAMAVATVFWFASH